MSGPRDEFWTYGRCATGCVFGIVAVALVLLVALAAEVFGGKP